MKVMAYAMAALLAGSATRVDAQTPNAAQSPPAPVLTHLHLSAEGAVSVTPDELVADLVVQARAASPAAAQGKVNALMKLGMQQAASVTSVTARAIGYSVQQVDLDAPVPSALRTRPEKPGWEAQQILELRASSGDQLFELVGKLQGEGFLVSDLYWRLSPELGRRARDEAMVEALKALRSRAVSAAAVLGLRLEYFQDIQVDVPAGFPVRPTMTARATVAAPPQATQPPEAVTSQISADIVLGP